MNETLKHIAPESRRMLAEAKQAILSVEPEAEVYLFGSRARGDFTEDSDWDLLVLLPGEKDYRRSTAINYQVHDIELKFLQMFNVVTYIKDYWLNNPVFKVSPFSQNVRKDNIPI